MSWNGRTAMSLLLAAFFLLQIAHTTQESTPEITWEGNCEYSGYDGSGNQIDIQPIKSPVVEKFDLALSFAFEIKSHVLANAEGLAETLELIKRFAKVATYASAAFGVFGAVFATVGFAEGPTPKDILEKVDAAFEEITHSMNLRISSMGQYVDKSIMDMERRLISREFKTLQNKWSVCLEEVTLEDNLRCQRDAARYMDTELPKYQNQPFKEDVDLYNTKILEASLLTFRDYASLHLYALKMLVGSYRNDSKSDDKDKYIKRYLEDIVEKGDLYVKYSQWAYDQIYKNKITNAAHQNDADRPKDQVITSELDSNTNSYFFYHPDYKTGVTVTANCPTMDETARMGCKVKYYKTVDLVSSSTSGRHTDIAAIDRHNRKTKRAADNDVKVQGKRLVLEKCDTHFKRLKKDLVVYWKTQLLETAKLWEKAVCKAKEELIEMGEEETPCSESGEEPEEQKET
ncbi:uncharacterized protein LOC116615470 [Nematostella vectensis]|uniref:uncharacterized protein LOC116615470 n=1 Tax=Nematostella vectensis TaxID=45351 RepID=UPI001390435A|nr:uncharacterized protein LOC116615470 [Nematostella vectensis]